MEVLPTELQELVCEYLDGDSLLKACCVSSQWCSIISSLQSVWKRACLLLGTGPLSIEDDDWKKHYISCRHVLCHLKQGCAFQHRNFIPESFRGSAIRGLVYSNGYLITVHCFRTVRLCDLQCGSLLWSTTLDSPVIQVELQASHILTHRHVLVVADEDSLYRFHWKTHINNMEEILPHIATTQKFLLHNNYMFYIRDNAVVMIEWFSGVQICQTDLASADISLIAVGAKFMLIQLWSKCNKKQELAAINLYNGKLIGRYPMPFCRPEYIVMGESKWLDGLAYYRPGDLVIAVSNTIQATDCFYVITWKKL